MVSDNTRDSLQRDYTAVKDDLRKLKTDGGTFAKDAYAAGCSSAADAGSYLKKSLRAARVRGRLGMRMASEQVSARPRTALAAAFGAGLMLGLFVLGNRS